MDYHSRLTYLFEKGIPQLTNKEGIEVFKVLTYLGLEEELKAFRFDWYAIRLTNLYEIQKGTPDITDMKYTESKLDHLKKSNLAKLLHDPKRSEVLTDMVELTREDILNASEQGMIWEDRHFAKGSLLYGKKPHIEYTARLASYIDELYNTLVKGVNELVKESYREYAFRSSSELTSCLRLRLLKQKGVASLSDDEFNELLKLLREQKLFDEVSDWVLKRACHKKRRMVHPIKKAK